VSIYAVVDPATGETVKEYPTISDDELRNAISRADQAHREWSSTVTVADRASLLRRVGELHSERRKELAEIIVTEMGKPTGQARGEVDFCASIYQFYADNAEALMADEPIELLDGDGSAVVRRSSVGVLLGIMPWNFPYYQVARFAGPNLIIGNTILLKHAPQCPQSAEAMQQIFDDAGFPDGAYVNIYATNEQIEWVIADPRVRIVGIELVDRSAEVDFTARLPDRLSHLGDDDLRQLLPPFRVQLTNAPHERGTIGDGRSLRPFPVRAVCAGDRVAQPVVADRRVFPHRLTSRGVDNRIHAHRAPPSVELRPTLRVRGGTMICLPVSLEHAKSAERP